MSSDFYYNLMKEAQNEKISLVDNNSRLLNRLYQEVANDLINNIDKVKGGFSKAWIKDYVNYLDFRLKKLQKELIKLNKSSIKESCVLAASVDGDFMSYIKDKYELDISEKDINGIYNVNQEVLTKMLNGTFYKNGLGVSKSIWTYTEKTKSDISYILAKGLAEQKDFKVICKDLEAYVDPSKKLSYSWKRIYPQASRGSTVDYNALRLLRTSTNHAFFNQMIANAKRNPFTEAIKWELSSEHYYRQVKRWGPDVCDDYAENDYYGLGTGVFPIDDVPIPHPNCLCYQYPVLSKSIDDIADDINDWLNGGDNILLDEYMNNSVA